MFDTLQEKLQQTFDRLAGKGKLAEADVDTAMRDVRLALLEADVNYKVVKDFVARVRERSVGAEVMRSLSPAQQVVKIVNEELVALLGEVARLDLSGNSPHVMLLVGLQGSGKTTTAAKLALQLRRQGQRPLMVAADTRRPAAITQLEVLGKQLDIPVHSEGSQVAPPVICANGVQKARASAYTAVILDTGGRLSIDDELMRELEEICKRTNPQEVLLVLDAMTGQEAVRVAEDFHKRLKVTGLILTKLDGDARGGAALSIRAVTGIPIKFVGVGEKTDALEPFYPDRMASRILGMGDVLTLIEKAQENVDREESVKLQRKLQENKFDLDDFLKQLQQIKKMGSITHLMEMIPGFSQMAKEIPEEVTDSHLKRVEAIIRSMNMTERRDPNIMNASRKRRVAKGSGTTVPDVNELLTEFKQMQRMMKQMRTPRGMRNLMNMFKQ
ncbi:MAG: signal recognition particle protein [Chloroflexi bacterium]|nr:signal recognition particle protein [Chloroflexota bacterium]